MTTPWEQRRIAVHGSSATPENPAEFKFQLFDYKTDNITEKPLHQNVNNGVDQGGPGIYCCAQKSGRAINKSVIAEIDRYANGRQGQGGSVIGLSFPGFTEDGRVISLMNDPKASPPNSISPMEWGAVLEQVVNERRRLEGFDLEYFLTVFNDFGERYVQDRIVPTREELQPIADKIGEKVEYLMLKEDPSRTPAQTRYIWERNCIANASMCDPARKLCEELNIESIDANRDHLAIGVENLFRRHDSAADLAMTLYRASAYEMTGKGSFTYNNTFVKAMQDNISQPELFQMTYNKSGGYHVIMDPRAITVECMVTTHYDLDETRFAGLISDLNEKIPELAERFDHDAVAKVSLQLIQHHMGVMPSEDLQSSIGRYGRDMDTLISNIRKDIADMRIVHWEREPGMMKKVLGITPPAETLLIKSSATPSPAARPSEVANKPSQQAELAPQVAPNQTANYRRPSM